MLFLVVSSPGHISVLIVDIWQGILENGNNRYDVIKVRIL